MSTFTRLGLRLRPPSPLGAELHPNYDEQMMLPAGDGCCCCGFWCCCWEYCCFCCFCSCCCGCANVDAAARQTVCCPSRRLRRRRRVLNCVATAFWLSTPSCLCFCDVYSIFSGLPSSAVHLMASFCFDILPCAIAHPPGLFLACQPVTPWQFFPFFLLAFFFVLAPDLFGLLN